MYSLFTCIYPQTIQMWVARPYIEYLGIWFFDVFSCLSFTILLFFLGPLKELPNFI